MGLLIIVKDRSTGNLLIVLSVAGAFNKLLKSFTFLLWFYATALDTGHQLIFINQYEYFLEMPHPLTSWDFSVHPLKPTFDPPRIVQEPGDLIQDDSIIFWTPGRARGPRKPSLLWTPRLSVLLLLSWCSAGDEGDKGSIPGLGRSSGGGNGNPLQYSCLENPMDRGAWWAIVCS